MKKNKNAPNRRPMFAPIGVSKLKNGIQEAKNLSIQQDYRGALIKLRDLDKEFPNNAEVLSGIMTFAMEVGMRKIAHGAIERLAPLHPNDSRHQQLLINMRLRNGYTMLMLEAVQSFNQRFPKENKIEVREMATRFVQAEMEGANMTFDETYAMLLCVDKLECLVECGEADEAADFGVAALATYPNTSSVHTLTVQALCRAGRMSEAFEVAEQAAQQFGENPKCLRSLAMLLPRIHQKNIDESRYANLNTVLSAKLRALPLSPKNSISEVEPIMQAMAWLGDDEGILHVYNTFCPRGLASMPKEIKPEKALKELETLLGKEGAEDEFDEETEFIAEEFIEQDRVIMAESWAYFCHYVACVHARQGDIKKAKTFWEKATFFDDNIEIIDENLEDIALPHAEQEGPWYISHDDILGERLAEEVQVAVTPRGHNAYNDYKTLAPYIRDFIAANPEIVALIPLILVRGDGQACQMALFLGNANVSSDITEAICAFALSNIGCDETRRVALDVMKDIGAFVGKDTVRVFRGGEWVERPIPRWYITYEVPEYAYPLSGKAKEIMEKAVDALNAKEPKKAEDLCREGLILEPNSPQFWNNLAQSFEGQGRTDESFQLVLDIYEKYPDYFVGMINRAALYVKDGDLEPARVILTEAGNHDKLYIADFGNLMRAWINLYIKENNIGMAEYYLLLLKEGYSDYPYLDSLEMNINALKSLQSIRSMLSPDLEKSLNKMIGRYEKRKPRTKKQ
jgi:tetratricopeptide (TPR) repeat protein